MIRRSVVLAALLLAACGAPSDPGSADAGRDAAIDAGGPIEDASVDAALDGGGVDAADGAADAGRGDVGSCLDEHAVGDRFPAGDGCNFCDCLADGSIACTERACAPASGAGCEYDGTLHAYAERFPSTDGCNECVCATSGLACTRRACEGALEEGAILLETLQQACGPDESFTAQRVLDTLPHDVLTAPFLYQRDRAGQEAIDLRAELKAIRRDAATPGSMLNRLLVP